MNYSEFIDDDGDNINTYDSDKHPEYFVPRFSNGKID